MNEKGNAPSGGWSGNGSPLSSTRRMSSLSDNTRRFSVSDRASSSSDLDDSDYYIAEALKSMSLQERDVVYHEVHGVADMVQESPAFLQESFARLKRELSKQTRKKFVGSLNCRPFLKAQKKVVIPPKMARLW